MNLQQMRYLVEVVKQDFNISSTAVILHTSQPGISKQIAILENELGVKIFERQGRRLIGLTAAGRQILPSAQQIVQSSATLKKIASDFQNEKKGFLSIATTHTQARYTLPKAIQSFRKQFPDVHLALHQGTPKQICDQVAEGISDIAIATEAIGEDPRLVSLPCFKWNRSIIIPPKHPLATEKNLTLERIAHFSLITYDVSFAGQTLTNATFSEHRIQPNITLTALDTDIIKTYVRLGLGVGLIASIAYDTNQDTDLVARDVSHLFPDSETKIGLRKNSYLRGFAYTFIEQFIPHLTKQVIERALSSKS